MTAELIFGVALGLVGAYALWMSYEWGKTNGYELGWDRRDKIELAWERRKK